MTNHPLIAPKPMPRHPAHRPRRGTKKHRAGAEQLIIASLLLLSVVTIIGFY